MKKSAKSVSEKTGMEAPEFLDSILNRAVALGASDLYLLPDEAGLEFRVRVGGSQRSLERVDGDLAQHCMTRLKVISGMLTYKTKLAQDGAVRLPDGSEFRVSVMPTIRGERATVRILRGNVCPSGLAELGYQPEMLERLRAMLRKPTGMLVLTGPTGSGKTTTMYAMVAELLAWKQDSASIITIEDPVEREISGVSQCSMTRGGEDWSYCEALKAALRQDVKTLVIGEMRDKEVLRIALDASLSGHRIITTYHAGDIAGVYARILLNGFEPFLVASSISGVVAQRLVSKNDGSARIPAAAALLPGDEWNEFVASSPSLSELRARVARIPGADIMGELRRMAASGLISQKDPNLL